MSAPEGNQFWKLRSTHGAPRKFETKDELIDACEEYFEERSSQRWNNQRLPFTQASLCVFLEITQETWIKWRKNNDLSEVVTRVDEIIRDNKMTGAMVGAYNHNIVARDLGLTDKQELTGKGGGPMQVIKSEMTPKEAAEAYAATLGGDDENT